MESLSRPLHRRKLSNANNFSGKHAYDGVFSGHRPAGPPPVTVDEYREIFSTSSSSIPVLDLSNLEESSDGLISEAGSTTSDYCKIFGGFRDHDIAISYEELVARDKVRVPSSTSQSSPDLEDTSHQSSDALKQYNMSYHKISQRNKDRLDGTTHVTQLHAVPGFTCFFDEPASNKETMKQNISKKQSLQNGVEFSNCKVESLSSPESKKENNKQKPPAASEPKKETEKQKPPAAFEPKKETEKQKLHATNNVPSSPPVASQESQPKKETEKQKPPAAFEPKKETEKQKLHATNNVPSSPPVASQESQPKKETEKQKPLAKNDVSSSPPSASQSKKGTKKQKSSVKNNVNPSENVEFPEKQTSQTAVDSQIRNGQDESFSGDRNLKTNISSSETKLDNHEGFQKRSTDTNEGIPPTCFVEEHAVNSAAAALKKAIEKAQESIRMAKASVGRKKEGRRGFSSKSFKDSLKVKARVANVNEGDGQKEKDDKMKERDVENGNVINETHGEKMESVKNAEVRVKSRVELNDNKMVCNSKQVGETESVTVENGACGNAQKDDERPDGFLEQGDTESNNLTVCQKVETKKEISQTSDQNGYEKKFNEESFELLENNMEENLVQEHDEKVVGSERQVEEDGGIESHSEEEKFYDVSEVEMVKNAQTYGYNIETNDLSQKEDHDNHKAEESYDNSSSDYDDAEGNENVIDAKIVDDTEEAVGKESSQNLDDVSSSQQFQVEYNEAVEKESIQNLDDVISSHTFQVEYKEAVETKDSENVSSDEHDAKSDVDFGQNDVQFESSSDTIHRMEIDIKEYKEKEETVKKEENNLQHEEAPEVRIEMDAGPPHEPKDASRESEPDKAAQEKEERERERIKLAVERAIREARERAFAEVRQRVTTGTQEKVTKASFDRTSAQFKLRAERALVEKATAEARQRALEKVMKASHSQPRTQVYETKQTSVTSQTNTESALRSKAKLEKHNRIMERAAKALAEKEKRDLLALREQAERHRLADHLDADIKRWSTGKEGNLRALLSTLQYILGAESGWQPVSLTEIITTSAVKKAYRKATLCVHPDKLQQRGASIQQKYICEKVFDLLKAAWNQFNSEER